MEDSVKDQPQCAVYEERRAVKDDYEDIVSLTHITMDEGALLQRAKDARAGAVSSFFGTTRDTFEDKLVTHLEYEAYPEMALQCMFDMCDKIRAQWHVCNIIIQHKLGPCPVKETSIGIVISSEHRKESLEAVHFAIDELKKTVPIWKKEFYNEGDASWKSNSQSVNFNNHESTPSGRTVL